MVSRGHADIAIVISLDRPEVVINYINGDRLRCEALSLSLWTIEQYTTVIAYWYFQVNQMSAMHRQAKRGCNVHGWFHIQRIS